MMERLLMIQIIMLQVTSPLFLVLAAWMVFQRPIVKPRTWYALAVLIGWISLVSLRDAYLLDEAHKTSWTGFVVRAGKFTALCTCLWFAWRERADAPRPVASDLDLTRRDDRQAARSERQDRREQRQDVRQVQLDKRDDAV